jgi:DNA-binding MarR family transcriptional regulator
MNQDTAARLSFELHGAARLMRRNFDRRAREHDLSRSRWQVLWVLAQNEGQKQAELAERLDVAPISLGRQLDNLEQEGLVERRRDAGDRRCFRIYLTEAAQPALKVLKVLAEQTRAEALAGLSPAEIGQLHDLLSRIRQNLSGEETTNGKCDK